MEQVSAPFCAEAWSPTARHKEAYLPWAGLLRGRGLQTAPFHAPRCMEPVPHQPGPPPSTSLLEWWGHVAARGSQRCCEASGRQGPLTGKPKDSIQEGPQQGLGRGCRTPRSQGPAYRFSPEDRRGGHNLQGQTQVWQLARKSVEVYGRVASCLSACEEEPSSRGSMEFRAVRARQLCHQTPGLTAFP